MYAMAEALAERGALGGYYSGYPRWKLGAPAELPVRTHSWRTLAVYSALKNVPGWAQPRAKDLFRWQDRGFDRWVGAHLEPCDFIHALPGQAVQTFRAAKRAGIRTVLNHATGPVREWVRIMEPLYREAGLRLLDTCPYDDAYFAQEEEEYALADWHCAASSVVRAQLMASGIDPARIWQVPYGADTRIFHPGGAALGGDFRMVFAGQLGFRKGLRALLETLTRSGRADWRADFYGIVMEEARPALAAYRGAVPLHFHGPVGQGTLAEAFREGSVLVLPSVEEGFGLVVPQALNCGLPAIVSDRVGAKDLVRHRENGSIFAGDDAGALLEELAWWAENPRRPHEQFTWSGPASTLIACSTRALGESAS